jgi:hypothetical protein
LSEKGGVLGNRFEQRLEPFAIGLGEVAEHMVKHQFLHPRMADADAYTLEVVTNMGAERAQAIMSGNPTTGLDPDLARREIKLVVN